MEHEHVKSSTSAGPGMRSDGGKAFEGESFPRLRGRGMRNEGDIALKAKDSRVRGA